MFLKNWELNILKVSRHPKKKKEISYSDLNEDLLKEYTVIVNVLL